MDLGGIVGQRGRRRQRLERQERRRAGILAAEVAERGPRVLEALDHDPLQAVAEHGLHRHLEPGRYLEQVGHGADHAGELGRRPVGEDRAHARAVALAVPLEPLERLERGFLCGDAHAKLGERLLRLGAPALPAVALGLHARPARR